MGRGRSVSIPTARRCDVDQAPRGPLARRTHLTDRRIRSARAEHTARLLPLWGVAPSKVRSGEMTPALDALEDLPIRRVRPAVPMAIIATKRSESERDHAFGPATAAKDQRRGIVPLVRRAVCSPPDQQPAPHRSGFALLPPGAGEISHAVGIAHGHDDELVDQGFSCSSVRRPSGACTSCRGGRRTVPGADGGRRR